ncbi:hypothetical protein Tco_0636375, partial [Tanacetum coccineum]
RWGDEGDGGMEMVVARGVELWWRDGGGGGSGVAAAGRWQRRIQPEYGRKDGRRRKCLEREKRILARKSLDSGNVKGESVVVWSLYILKDSSEVLSVRESHNSRDSISLKEEGKKIEMEGKGNLTKFYGDYSQHSMVLPELYIGELTLRLLDVLQEFSFFLQMGFTLILATLDGLDVGLLGDVTGEDDCDDDG